MRGRKENSPHPPHRDTRDAGNERGFSPEREALRVRMRVAVLFVLKYSGE